jgi:hypothetical protein
MKRLTAELIRAAVTLAALSLLALMYVVALT